MNTGKIVPAIFVTVAIGAAVAGPAAAARPNLDFNRSCYIDRGPQAGERQGYCPHE